MTKVQLNQKEQHYADTREEAEEIVSAAKENNSLQMHKITEKHNKYGQYFLVDLTFAYQTPKEVMESRPQKDDAPDGQLSADDLEEPHEGMKYNVEQDGSVSVPVGQLDTEEVAAEQ
ncbi:hypothetical protein [Pseudobacillus badius]|uniref:hypothetical protein n=1 Tax=Bacillus badius TaxID=1455 RepID=UPI0007B3DEDF|nr:hypothetical protein [Bacillus badius]KZR60407.1 organic solvent tolerance protein OstA [Bacillus badius]